MATHGSRWYLMRSDGILCQASLVGTHKSVFGSSGNLQKNIQAKLRETFGLSRNTQAIDLKFTLWGGGRQKHQRFRNALMAFGNSDKIEIDV